MEGSGFKLLSFNSVFGIKKKYFYSNNHLYGHLKTSGRISLFEEKGS